jgi:hypothetical protein
VRFDKIRDMLLSKNKIKLVEPKAETEETAEGIAADAPVESEAAEAKPKKKK